MEGIKDMTEEVEMSMMGMSLSTETIRIPDMKCFSMIQSMGGNPVSKILLRDGKITVSAGGMEQEITDPAQVEAMSDVYLWQRFWDLRKAMSLPLKGSKR